MAELPRGASATVLPSGAVPATEEDPGIARFVDNVVRMIAQGATLGFADEFAGFMRSRTEGIPFEQAVAEERARDVEFREESPGTALTANIVGGIASPVSRVAAAARGAGLLAQTGRGAGAGAGLGAVAGAGEAEGGIGERAEGAAFGAATGGVLGAATPALVRVAGVGLQRLGRIVTGQTGPKPAAARKILQALQDDNINAQEAVERLKKLGPQAGLADVGEENVRGLARAVTSVPGPARTVGKEFFEARQLSQGGRIVERARKAFGEFRKFAGSSDELLEARAAAAAPRYRAAFETEVPLTDELQAILQTNAGKRALATARQIASNEGRTLPKITETLEDGTVVVESTPDMRAWDIIKRAMDTVLNRQRNQLTGRLDLSDPMAFSVNDVRGRLVAELDRLNPAYKEARAVFAGPSAALDAMNRGRGFLKGDVDLTAKVIKGMTPAERDFFRLGVIRGVEDVVENTRDVTDVTGRLFGSQAMRDKIRAVFPDDKAFNQFKEFMEAEAEMAVTRKAVLGGSPTARIQAEQESLAAPTNALVNVFMGRPVEAIGDAARQALNRVRSQISPEMSEELGRVLFTPGGEVNEQAIRRLFQAEPIRGLDPEVRRQLIRGMVTAAGITGAELTAGQ